MNDEETTCEGCGKVYYPAGRWQHERCGVDLRTGKRHPGDQENKPEEPVKQPNGQGHDSLQAEERNPRFGSPKQRWDRQSYNAYMKTYMKNRRKK